MFLQQAVLHPEKIEEYSVRADLVSQDEIALGDQVDRHCLRGIESLRRREGQDVGEELPQPLTSLGEVRVVLDVVLGDEFVEAVESFGRPVDDLEQAFHGVFVALQVVGDSLVA
ncbi:hypothetical protein AQJ64_17260 [Streptomyces griseoruber]|uniref:Uncharacterized protein n=1 Tax=Streptomyces griseoruber TaxID=1943 RepID=A0A117RCR6_9ACTN|nr:hypothetical protein AQJ64_17260 [Streptomyces griseoruber]